jgi:hypothetical protein
MREKAYIELVERVGGNPILCDWTDPRYSRKGQTLSHMRKYHEIIE